MSDHTHEYVECDGCGIEVRKEPRGLLQKTYVSPKGWLKVTNPEHMKIWDVCPTCAKAFTEWLLKRNGARVEATQPVLDDYVEIEHCVKLECLRGCPVTLLEQSGWLKTDAGWLCVDPQPF